MFGWFKGKNTPKRDGAPPIQDPGHRKLYGLAAFDPVMQSIRDLERLGQLSDASEKLRLLLRDILPVLRDDALGFATLLRAYDEVERRGRDDLMAQVITALSANPMAKTADGSLVIHSLLDKLDAQEESAKRGGVPFYACQRCGSLLLHLSVPCTECRFLCDTQEEVLLGICLSSQYIEPGQLAALGRDIGIARPPHQVIQDLEKQLAGLRRGGGWEVAAKVLEQCRKSETANFDVIPETGPCSQCGEVGTPYFCLFKCFACGNEVGLADPAARRYKWVLRDCLRWIQLVRPDNDPARALVIYDLVRLKEIAVHDGRYVAPEEGYRLKRHLEALRPMVTDDGAVRISFSATGVFGELVGNTSKDTKIHFRQTRGQELFNMLIEYYYQGVPILP